MEISAKTKEKPEAVTCTYDLPNDLAGLVAKYKEDVVYSAAKGAIVIAAQAVMRRHIDKGTDAAGIQAALAAWSPDVRTVVGKSAFEKATSALDKLKPEERAALLEKLRALG